MYYLLFISFVLFRIAYSVWMLKDLVGKSHGRNYSIRIMYDIGCLLTKHLQVKINRGSIDGGGGGGGCLKIIVNSKSFGILTVNL